MGTIQWRREPVHGSSSVESATQPRVSPLRSGRAKDALVSLWSTAKARVQPWLTQIVLVWLAGVMVVAVRPMLSWYTVRRMRRVGVSPVDGVVQGVLRADGHAVPARPSGSGTAVDVGPYAGRVGLLPSCHFAADLCPH